MCAYVYVLREISGPRTYVGWTNDLAARLAKHNAGAGARTTRGKQWTLIYAERLGTRVEAMSREVRLKRDRNFRAKLRAG